MLKNCIFSLFVFLLAFALVQANCPSQFFSSKDSQHLLNLIKSYETADGYGNLDNTYNAVSSLAQLGVEVPNKDKICSAANGFLGKKGSSLQELYQAAVVTDILKCTGKVDADALSRLEDGLESTTISDLFYSASALKLLATAGKVATDDSGFATAVEKVMDLMESDGTFLSDPSDERASPYNTGLALEILAAAGANDENVETVVSNVEELFSLAEEDNQVVFSVETNALDNICATAFMWKGINSLSKAVGGVDIDITTDQVVGLGEYFVQNKKVTNLKDANCLVTGLTTVANNNFHTPLVLTFPKGHILTSSKDDVSVRVTDIFGKFAEKTIVYLVKAFPINDESNIVLSNQAASPDNSDNTLFSFNFLNTKPEPGYYSMEFSVAPAGNGDSKTFAIEDVIRNIKVVSAVNVADFDVAITDSVDEDDREYGSRHSMDFGAAPSDALSMNALQHIFFTFRIRNQVSGKHVNVHQAFIRFEHVESDFEAIFVVSQKDGEYSLHLNMREANEFGSRSGTYRVYLTVGDSFIANPFDWNFANLDINFGKNSYKQEAVQDGPLPEILHEFRPAEKRPPQIFSLAFAIAVLAVPLLFFLIGLGRVGFNFSLFPSGGSFLFAVGFHICIGAVIALYTLFWLKLNMLQTLSILIVLIPVTIFFGLRTLRALQSRRRKREQKQT